MDGSVPPPEPEEVNASAAPDRAETALELARLAKLPQVEFAQERRAAASRLGMPVQELERAVKALRQQAFRQREEAARESARSTPGAVLWPSGFRMEERGLVFLSADDDKPPVLVASRFEVRGESRSSSSLSWGLWLA